MKCFYTQDPTPQLIEMMDQLESRIRWRPRPDLPLLDRIYRFGQGFLASKEVEFLGQTQSGNLPERLRRLAKKILQRMRDEYGLKTRDTNIIDQIRDLRRHLIKEIERCQSQLKADGFDQAAHQRLGQFLNDMDDLFFVTQLSSYHGNYTVENPTIERIAETIDKFEEDVFELQCPTPRGERKAVVQFGETIQLEHESFKPSELTRTVEQRIQGLMDQINKAHLTTDGDN